MLKISVKIIFDRIRPFFDAWEDGQIYTQIMDSGDYYELQHRKVLFSYQKIAIKWLKQ